MTDRRGSLRRQLLVWLLVPVLGCTVAGSVVTYLLAAHFASAAYDRVLYGSILDLAKQVRVRDGGLRLDLPQAALEMLEWNAADRVFYRVATPAGTLLSGAAGLPQPPQPLVPDRPQFYDGQHGGVSVRVAAMDAGVPATGGTARLHIQVAETLEARREIVRQILLATVLPETLLAALAGVALWVGVRRGLAPLERLQQEVGQRSVQDLSPIDEAHTPLELRLLVRSINGLLTRLGESLSAQRRFVANAAHQLRTPLAGIRTQAEVALRASEPAQMQHTLGQLREATERTSHMLNQLLSLARLEPGAGPMSALQRVDLAEASRAVTAQWVPQALRRDVDLGFEASPGPALVRAEPLLLEELLGNLIDNALVHGRARGEVTVRVSTREGDHVLAVEDDGPGIPAAERERVFERFERGTGVAQPPGTGLGLAIVREIATTHGAHVTLRAGRAGRGTCVEVSFPAAG